MENKIYNYYRFFGWSIIAAVFAFLVNNVLQLSFGFQSIFSLENKFSITSVIELIIYFFSLIMLLGFSLALKAIYLPLALLLIFVIFHIPTIANEERKLRTNHGDKFESYMKSTPRLIPNIFKYKRPETGEKVLVKISRINGVLIEVIGYLFLYTLIDIIYFILD